MKDIAKLIDIIYNISVLFYFVMLSLELIDVFKQEKVRINKFVLFILILIGFLPVINIILAINSYTEYIDDWRKQ